MWVPKIVQSQWYGSRGWGHVGKGLRTMFVRTRCHRVQANPMCTGQLQVSNNPPGTMLSSMPQWVNHHLFPCKTQVSLNCYLLCLKKISHVGLDMKKKIQSKLSQRHTNFFFFLFQSVLHSLNAKKISVVFRTMSFARCDLRSRWKSLAEAVQRV